MKKMSCCGVLFVLSACLVNASAATFLPVMPEGGERVAAANNNREVFLYAGHSTAQLAQFFSIQFRNNRDIVIHESDGSGSYVIKDWGRQPWRRIEISRDPGGAAKIIVIRDSWTWNVGMLFIRFAGVLLVLTILYISLNISHKIVALRYPRSDGEKP